MKIVTVFRSGKDFKPEHVQALKRQCEKHAPWSDFLCLSDVPVSGVDTVPLVCNWPGWWSKMEMFAPEMRDDFLYMDLDTVVVGDLDDVLMSGKLTILRDFFRDGRYLKEGLGSGIMYLPWEARAEVWDAFSVNPGAFMRKYARGGDQSFLEELWLKKAARWQDAVPGQIVSYKVHCCGSVLGKGSVFRGIPTGARIVSFHGKPRPWDVNEFRSFYE